MLLSIEGMSDLKKIMTPNPTCCVPGTSLEEVAQMMVDCDCGEIPVVRSQNDKTPVGVITDRDITVRTLAMGKNPLGMKVEEVMTKPCVTVRIEASVDECGDLMEKNQIRRVPVVDGSGKIVGIVAQADLARRSPKESAEVVKAVSQPNGDARGSRSTI